MPSPKGARRVQIPSPAPAARPTRLTIQFLAVVTVLAALVQLPGPSHAASGANGVAGMACDDMKLAQPDWWHNWYVDPGCDVPGYVPMVSGRDKQDPGDIKWQVDRAHSAGFRTVIGFNEPNQKDQSDMSVQKALDLWPVMTSYDDMTVGSPAVSGNSSGDQWIADFMRGVEEQGLRVDFVTAHFFGWEAGSCTAANLESYLGKIKKVAGGRPIWVTEMGCLQASNKDAETVQAFYDDAVEVLTRLGIARWAWYAPEKNHALASEGALTSLGEDFAGR